MTGMNENVAALLPELLLLAAAVVGLLLGAWLPRDQQWLVRALATAAAAAGIVATAYAMTQPDQIVFGLSYAVDTLTYAARLVVLVSVLLALGLSVDGAGGHRRETEFTVLVLLAGLGAIVLAGANTLLLLFAGFLLASVPLYALAGWDKEALGVEAAMKYYLTGAFLGVTMLAGTAILYGAARSTSYPALREGLGGAPAAAAAVGLVAVLAGVLFKIGAVPAHFWVPDVTDGTPPAVAAIVTTIPKIGGLIAAYRLLLIAVPADVVDWPLLVAVLATASMTLGNLAAFFQQSVQRLLAYSTISQVGYLLVAVAAAGRSELAQPALLFYLGAYAVTNLAVFAVVAELPAARSIEDYRGLARRHPGLAAVLVISLLGLVGTPPTGVFVGKLTVFTAAINADLAWLAVVAVANTVASVFYYLRWIAPAFITPTEPIDATALVPAGRWSRRTAYAAATVSVLLGPTAGVVLPLFARGPAA